MAGLEVHIVAAPDTRAIPGPDYLAAPVISRISLQAHSAPPIASTANVRMMTHSRLITISLSICFTPPDFVVSTAAAAAEIGHDQVLIILRVMIGAPD
jgi:hypothetical protein